MITYTAELGDLRLRFEIPTEMMDKGPCSLVVGTLPGEGTINTTFPKSELADLVSHLRNML